MTRCGTLQDIRSLPKRAVPSDLAAVGRKLRDLRESHGVSLGELARFMGAKVSRLSDLETGMESDPRFWWCPHCTNETWRDCVECGGKGYVAR